MTLIPDDVAEALTEMSASQLRAVAHRAEKLADEKDTNEGPDRKRSKAEVKHDVDADDFEKGEAPPGATLVTKNIDDRDYYYWNWREDGTVRSEYIAPVAPKN